MEGNIASSPFKISQQYISSKETRTVHRDYLRNYLEN